MLLNLFNEMRAAKVPVSVRELLDLHQALQKRVVFADMDEFYYLARAILVKDERHFDKFDRAFGAYFKGLEKLDDHLQALIPEDWLRKEFERRRPAHVPSDPPTHSSLVAAGPDAPHHLVEPARARVEAQAGATA